jgi:TPP-dependent pyruvate/acetoin dehydrogenase alpha subunit
MTKFHSELGDLANPKAYNEPLDIMAHSKADCKHALYQMLLIRETETSVAELIKSGGVKCPCHLGVGQEAIAVGVASQLRATDRAFGTHRSHPLFLAMGGSLDALYAEILGKITGCSKGLGGSMHLISEEVGFKGSVPIVGATVPLAVGAALAAKLDGNSAIAICSFGDGACEEGVVHESLNLAAVYELPVLFLCENNLFSSHLDIHLRQMSDRMARFADAHHIPSRVVDGNDVFEVQSAAEDLISSIRDGKGPAFLETVTYRWLGHVGPNEDIDVGVRRSTEELNLWKNRDPIKRLVDAMINNDMLDMKEYEILFAEVQVEVKQAKEKAIAAPLPAVESFYDNVYKAEEIA